MLSEGRLKGGSTLDIRHTTFNIIRHLLPRALLALLLAALALSASPALAESTPPGAVSSVSLTRADGTVTASWDAPSGATKYHVTYSDNGGASWHAPVDDHRNVTTTSLTFSADNAKTYIVGVRAGNDGGWSGWVNSPSAGPYTPPTLTPTPPGAVSSVSLTRADGTVTASWDAPTGATKYHVTYSDNGGASWHAPVDDHRNVTTTSLTFSADNAKTYIVGVRAGNDGGWSGWVNSPSAGPYAPNPPAAPTGLTAKAGDGSVTLSWDDPSDSSITGYEYNVNHNDTSTGNLSGWGPWTAIAGSGANTVSHTFTGLANGKEYRYHLRAVNAGGAGGAAPNAPPWFAAAVPAVPVPAAPSGLSVTPGDGYLDISWDAVSVATGYDIRAKTAGSSSWHSVANNVSGTSHRYTTDQTIDYIAVRARNADAVGPWAELSRLPSNEWLNTVQSSDTGRARASIASAQSQSQLAAPTWGTIRRGDDTTYRSGRIDVNWTGDSNATGYNLVCAVAGSTPASTGWNWHPCGWVDAATDTVKFTTVPANASQPVGIVSYKRGAESQLPPGIIPLEGSQVPHTIPRMYAVAIRAVSATPSNASAWVPSASIKPLNPQLSNLTHTRTDGQIALSWTPNPWTTGYEIDCAVLGSAYTRCATLTNQDHSDAEHSVTISTWTAGGTNYSIDNTSIYDVRICSTNTWGYGCHLAPLIYPNPSLTASNVAVTTATLTIAHHSGNWYYQHTNTGATCVGPVSGTSKDLTGLTANTAYTYSAYSDSTCSTLLDAAAPFTTLSSVSNLTSTKHPTFESQVHNALSAAVAFTTGSNASGYVLKSVTVPLKNTGGTSGVIFQLRAISGTEQYSSTSQISAASLATLSTATPTASTYTDTTVTCSGNGCSLSPDTTYFIVASSLDEGLSYSWAVSTSEAETAQPSGNGWSVGFGHYKQGSRDTIWGSYSDWNIAKLVFATNPNPNPSLTSSNVAATTATLTIANHTDAWYYKHTNTGATCQGPVAAGTSTASLSGLTGGTSYTYSAYSDSTCSTLLATAASFTTPSLTASSVTGTGATLTIGGHAGNWWYQANTGPDATCSSTAVSATTKNLTGLTAGTVYVYTAYSKSGCNAADLLATASFGTTGTFSVSNITGTLSNTIFSPTTTTDGYAQEFTTGSATGGYTLSSVTLDFTLALSPSAFTVAIHGKQSNGKPATTARATLSGTAASGNVTFTCTAGSNNNCSLDASTPYFVRISTSGGYAAYAHTTSSDAETLQPSNNGWSIADVAIYEGGGWVAYPSGEAMRMTVSATATASATLTATSTSLTIGNYTGSWYYQANAAPHATCQGPVSGTSQTISGLTSGTSYTYKAYADSGCTTLLATAAAFTAP